MSVAISPSEPPIPAAPAPGMQGRAAIRLGRRGAVTRLLDLQQAAPLRALFPAPAAGDPLTCALVTTSGGLVGGDRLEIAAEVGAAAAGLFVAQAAEKVYRSTGADACIELHLRAEAGAWAEYLPQETILFEGARLSRRTRLDCTPGARVLAGEMVVFGRTARGERMTRGRLLDGWRVYRGGRLVWADALHLEGDGDVAAQLAAPAGFAGCHALATLALVVDQPAGLLELLREAGETPEARFGATVVNGVLIGRWLAAEGLALRPAFARAWGALRAAVAGLPPSLPRLWHV